MLVVVTLLAGCAPKRSSPEPTTAPTVSLPGSASPSAAPTNPDVAAVQAAVGAYRGMWDAYMRVLTNPDPASPELRRFATGAALQTLVDGVGKVKEQGLKGEGFFALAPRVTEIAPASGPTKVGVRDCVNTTDSRIVRASPGPAYSDSPGGRRLCVASVEHQGDGSWKVSSFGLQAVGTCS
jgi:hypothetical protein